MGRGARRWWGWAAPAAMLVVSGAGATGAPRPPGVTAVAETAPVRHGGDAADDPAIWVDPGDPSRSALIGTDKQGDLAVYDLDGRLLFEDRAAHPGNVDVRTGFPLGGGTVDLVVISDRGSRNDIAVYRIDPTTRALIRLGQQGVGVPIYGLCLFHSRVTGSFFAFATGGGAVEQWELTADGSGAVTGRPVRRLDVGSVVEGCVADDAGGRLYVGEEDVGLWEYDAEPAGDLRTMVSAAGPGTECLRRDVEGVALFDGNGPSDGYLVASSQGDSSFCVFRRASPHTLVGKFAITSGAVDGVTGTDGIEIASTPLGARFPAGLFVAQDHENPGSRQNYKLVPWERIAAVLPVPSG